MTHARRARLDSLDAVASTNAGLWIDRCLPAVDGNPTKQQHIADGSDKIRAAAGYPEAFARWETSVQQTARADAAVVQRWMRVAGRLIVGLGNKGPLEAGLTLSRTWGVPILPGTALKGVAAAAARQLVQDDAWRGPTESQAAGASYVALFGDTDEAGAVAFLDAWWIPPPDNAATLHKRIFDLDVITTHHADYYTSQPPKAPTDMDDPVPISFATTKGGFLSR